MAKNLVLSPILVPLTQIWVPNFFFVNFTSRAWCWSIWPKFGLPIFFCLFVCLFVCFPPPPKKKNLAPSGIRYHGQVSSCSISEKTNNLILRKLSDRRRRPDWQTNGQTGKSDFIGCCPTNVERPTTASHMIPINKKKYLFKGDVSPNKWFILNSRVYQFSYA